MPLRVARGWATSLIAAAVVAALAGTAAADVLIAPERPPHHNRPIAVGGYIRIECWYRPSGQPGRSIRVTVHRRHRRLVNRRIRCRSRWSKFRLLRARRPGRYATRVYGSGFRGYKIVTRVRR